MDVGGDQKFEVRYLSENPDDRTFLSLGANVDFGKSGKGPIGARISR